MKKKKYAVIGHPIGHTMSPFIHDRLFKLEGIEAEYNVLDISPSELKQAVQTKLNGLDGYNITIPHKQAIIPFLTQLDRRALSYGSVNTVCNKNSSTGYTTDPDGFLTALRSAGIPLKGKVVILGGGGVARTFAFEAARAGADVILAVRREDILQAATLCTEISSQILHASCSSCFLDRISHISIDLLINATPVGMYPNTSQMPTTEDAIKKATYVFDAVYNPIETQFLACARSLGKITLGGMSMLVWQAAAAHEIWNNSSFNTEDIIKLCEDSTKEMERLFSQTT